MVLIVKKEKYGIECHFTYVHKSDGKFKRIKGFTYGKKFRQSISFPKKGMSSETKRKQMAIWLASKVDKLIMREYQKKNWMRVIQTIVNSVKSTIVIRWDLI